LRSANTQRDIYAAYGRSGPQRIFLTLAVAACVGVAWWVLSGRGIEWTGAEFGRSWQPGDEVRRLCLGIALTIYFVRLLFTQFVFLKRALSWGEACTIAPWVLLIYLTIAFAGGSDSAPFAAGSIAGCVLFVAGSWLNSYAEYARHEWKEHPQNRGHLYTLGSFRYSRHPNYLGDLISFSGLCLIAGRWPAIVIPSIMLAGFVFVNIPMLDAHLREHYGAEFDAWAARTPKLIPFIY
jgi:protein-S-isoprenylcysteine O-methyltransferase Ste14